MDVLASYVVSLPALWEMRAEAGSPSPDHCFDSRSTASAEFISLLSQFDQRVYAPLGMRMPRWVLYDCAIVPGMVFGLAAPRDTVDPAVVAALDINDAYRGPVPVSMLIALPGLADSHWLVYTVVDIDQAVPRMEPQTLRARTLAAAIAFVGARQVTATVQWRGAELAVHAGRGAMELLAAWLPAHDKPATAVVCYGDAKVFDDTVRERVAVADDRALEALQQRIEAGERIGIAGPPEDGVVSLLGEVSP